MTLSPPKMSSSEKDVLLSMADDMVKLSVKSAPREGALQRDTYIWTTGLIAQVS